MIIGSTEFQNNVGFYLRQAGNQDIVITKNGKEIARLIGAARKGEYLVDALSGLLPKDFDAEKAKAEYFEERYGL